MSPIFLPSYRRCIPEPDKFLPERWIINSEQDKWRVKQQEKVYDAVWERSQNVSWNEFGND